MKNLCCSCSRNMNDFCEIYMVVPDDSITSCSLYDVLIGEYSLEERLNYDYILCGGEFEESKTN